MSNQRKIEEVLANCAKHGEIRMGKKHLKIFLDGRMVAVFSHNDRNSSQSPALRNVIATIKRADRAA